MNREETIALFLRGRDAWNAWAEKMPGERQALEADGGWAAELDWRGVLEPRSEKTRAWMEEAMADFSEAAFETASWPKLKPGPRQALAVMVPLLAAGRVPARPRFEFRRFS